MGECSTVFGQLDPMPTWVEARVNTTQLCGLRMREAISRRKIGALVPGKVGMVDVRLTKPQMWTTELFNL